MLRLRPYKKCDAEAVVSWFGTDDEATFRMWCADRYTHYPITAEELNAYYAAYEMSDSFYVMTAFDETGVVGHMIMRFTDPEKRILHYGFIAIDREKRGRGYGREMLTLATRYAFELLGADLITLGVYDRNLHARRCYASLGLVDGDPANNESCRIMGEDWCFSEMVLRKSAWHPLSSQGTI